MSYETYKILHIVGLILVFLALGSAVQRGSDRSAPGRGATSALHGIGLIILLVAGFGMLARLKLMPWPWPGWVLAKIAIWLVIGGALALTRRLQPAGMLYGIFALLGGCAAWLAIQKPF